MKYFIYSIKLLQIVEKKFPSFEFRCNYDNKFTNVTHNEEVILPISLRYMEFISEYHWLNKKIKNARNNCFIFNEIVKLTKRIF